MLSAAPVVIPQGVQPGAGDRELLSVFLACGAPIVSAAGIGSVTSVAINLPPDGSQVALHLDSILQIQQARQKLRQEKDWFSRLLALQFVRTFCAFMQETEKQGIKPSDAFINWQRTLASTAKDDWALVRRGAYTV